MDQRDVNAVWLTSSSMLGPEMRKQGSGWIPGWAPCLSRHLTGCCSWETEPERHWRWCCGRLNLVGKTKQTLKAYDSGWCDINPVFWNKWQCEGVKTQNSLFLFSSFFSLLIWLGRAFLEMDLIFLGLEVIFRLGPPLASTTLMEQEEGMITEWISYHHRVVAQS